MTIGAVAYSADSLKYLNSFAKMKEKRNSFQPRNLGKERKKKFLLASKSGAHIEKIHEKTETKKLALLFI